MIKTIEIGKRIEATRPADSFYSRVRGTVKGVRNGFIQIEADEVIPRGSKNWEKHPSSCSLGVSFSNVVLNVL